MGHRHIYRILLVAAVLVFVGLAARNVVLELRIRALAQAGRGQAAEPFGRGDSILRVPLVEEAGQGREIQEYLNRGTRAVYFFSPHCGECEKRLPQWLAYFDAYGYDGVLFVNCDAAGDWESPVGIDRNRLHVVRLARPNPVKSKLPFIPLLITVNECGIVRERVAQVADLPFAIQTVSMSAGK